MSRHISSTTSSTNRLHLSDEEAFAITVSPGALWSYSQQHLLNPPKAFLQVTGSHLVKDGSAQKSIIDFDIWIDCSEDSELEWIQIKESAGIVTYSRSSAITSELDSPLGQWYQQYANNLSQQHGFLFIKEVSQNDKAIISAQIKLLADGVNYGGTLTTKSHDLEIQIDVPPIKSSSIVYQKAELKSRWSCKWPFTEYSQNVSEELLHAKHLQIAMVNQLKGWITLGDLPPQKGMSLLRRGIRMGNREIVFSDTVPTETGNYTRQTVRFSKWGCDEIST